MTRRIPSLAAALLHAGAAGSLLLAGAAAARPFDPGKASFSLAYKEETSPYRVNAVFLMPGEVLDLEVTEATGAFLLLLAAGDSLPGTSWRWPAPAEAGLHPLRIVRSGGTCAGAAGAPLRPVVRRLRRD